MPDDMPREFASQSRCMVVAAAGCGKTELIADAVASSPATRQLILTHTHAGVRALRDRLHRKAVDPKTYRIDTIAGFALRYTSSFPYLSGCSVKEPSGDDYPVIYRAAERVFRHRHVRDVLVESYDGVYVDEYQDCTLLQHELIRLIADALPTRVVGDPLQGVFDFGPDHAVDWVADVRPQFPLFDELTTPYRWLASNPQLGKWLSSVRQLLLSGGKIDLRAGPSVWTPLTGDRGTYLRQQTNACHRCAAGATGSVAAIRKWEGGAHTLAKNLQGHFRSMEEMECKKLMSFCSAVDDSSGIPRAQVVLEFVSECVTSQPGWFSGLKRTVAEGRLPTQRQSSIPGPVGLAVQGVADNESVSCVHILLRSIKDRSDIKLFRRELYDETLRTTRNYDESSEDTLQTCAWKTRDRTRIVGRRMDRRLVSRTLLVKGLEFDHAIIVDVDEFNDAKNLYVALTRGAKSLTVMSRDSVIQREVPNVGT